MRTPLIFSVFAIVMFLMSCRKDVEPVIGYELVFEFPDTEFATRSISYHDNMLSNVQVFVYDDMTGRLEISTKVVSDTSCSVRVRVGPKTVYAVSGMSEDLLGRASSDELKATVTMLSDNDMTNGAFVMFGNGSVTVSSAGDNTCTMEMRRIASKISLGAINVNFDGDAGLDGKSVTVDRIYVMNAVVKARLGEACPVSASDFINRGVFVSSDYDEYVVDAPAWTIDDNAVTSDVCIATYFVYPNSVSAEPWYSGSWSSANAQSTLVVEATVNGRKTYYPVPLGVLKSNCVYSIDSLTISGYGVDNPVSDPEKAGITCSVSVNKWGPGPSINSLI